MASHVSRATQRGSLCPAARDKDKGVPILEKLEKGVKLIELKSRLYTPFRTSPSAAGHEGSQRCGKITQRVITVIMKRAVPHPRGRGGGHTRARVPSRDS